MRRASQTLLRRSDATFTKVVRLCGFVFASLLALTYSTRASGEDSYPISYSGRLTQSNGAPLDGPVDVEVSFYRDVSGGTALIESITKQGLNLANGVFSLELPLTGADLKTVFEDGSRPVYIEITAGGKTYPRQKYVYAPLALRIPINDKQLAYDDTTGKLGLKMDASATEGSVLTVGSGGGISWKKIEAANLVVKDASGAAPTSNQVLVYKDGSWVAGAVPSVASTQASSTSSGYLSSADWNTFNAKQNALGFTPVNKSGDSLSGSLNMGGQAVTGLASPTATSDAATKGYVDGLALRKDGSTQLTSAWNVGAQNITNTGDLIMAGSKVLGLGANTSDPALSGASDKGKLWFNSTSNELKYWDGSTAKILGVAGAGIQGLVAGSGITVTGSSSSPTVALSSVGTAGTYFKVTTDAYGRVTSGTALSSSDLPNTTVTPGTYTRATVTVDQQGRLTAASSGAEIADSDIASSAGIAQSKISGLTSDLAAINASVAIKEAAITAGAAGQYWSGNKTWQTLNTTAVPEGTNQYFTNTRAISALSSSAPINYSVVTGEISITQASGTANGYLSSADWAAFNGKQAALGFTPVNKAGDTITGSLNMGGNDLLATGNIQLSAARTLGLGVYASDPTGLTASDKGKTWFNSTANQIKFWDGSAALALGVAGSGLGSLNGQSGNTQAFATPGSAGTAPSWSSNANAHTLNIPMASAVGVTAGLVSNSDHVAFSNKVSNVAQGVGIAVTTGSGTATVSLSMTGTAGSYAKITTDAYGRVTSGTTLTADDIPPLNASAISTGILPVANGGTGAATLATGNVLLGNGTNAVQSVAPGTSGNVLTSNGSTWQSLALPATNWAAPGTIGSTTPNTGAFTSLTAGETRLTELASNGTNYVGFKAPDVLGANKVWVLPANDGTAGQLLKTDGAGNLGWASDGGGTVTNVTATAPISVSNNSTTPAISISQANGTTNGYLTYTDWNTFNSKQAAGNYVTALTGDVTTSGFSAGSATATLASVSLAGTSTKVTYDVKGRVNSGTTLDATDLPPHSAALITSGTLAVANGGTGLSTTPSAGQILIGNGTGYSLSTLTAGTGINISNAAGAVTVSSTVDTSTKVSKQGDTMTGALSLPANGLVAGTSQLVLAGGNVGIGTTLPSSALTVQASANKGITLRQNTVADRFQMFVGDGTSGTVADDDYIRNLNTTLHIQTGSSGTTEAMTIGVDGNVGIGKLTPTNALDINGSLTLSNNQGIFWRNAAGVQNQVLRTDSGNNIYTGDIFGNFNGLYAIRTSGLDRLTVLPNGNVGIGITNPGAKLHLLNDVTDTNSSGDLYAYSLLRSTSNGTIYATSSEFVSEPIIASGLTNGGDIYGTVTRGWRTSASDTGTLVGLYGSWIGYGHLGTTNRSTHNAVGVNIQPYAEGGSITNSFGLIIQAPSTGGTITNNYGIYQASASAKNYFGGNVGIGTTAPAAKFTVYGAESTQSGLAAAIQLTNSSATGGNSWYLRAGAPGTYTPDAGFSIADNGAYRLTINSAGNVGIGTATPTAALDVNGTIKGNIPGGGSYSETTQTTTTRNQWINSTVNLTVPQTGTYMIQMNARMWGLGLSDFWWKARVYNETSGGQLCVAIGLGYSGTMSKGDGTVGMTRVAALTAGDVIRLQFAISGNDTNTVYFTGDGNGGSGISIIRISN